MKSSQVKVLVAKLKKSLAVYKKWRTPQFNDLGYLASVGVVVGVV